MKVKKENEIVRKLFNDKSRFAFQWTIIKNLSIKFGHKTAIYETFIWLKTV